MSQVHNVTHVQVHSQGPSRPAAYTGVEGVSTMALIESGGNPIFYELTGDTSLPALVFSHSLGVSHAMWKPQLAALASRRRILRYDTRGHGGSAVVSGSDRPDSYTIDALGADLLGLLDALELESVDFCGLSMGGVVGQWLAVHAPKRLRRLVLANTAAKIGVKETWDTRIAAVAQDGLASVIPGTLERWFTGGFRASHPEVVARTEAMLRATSLQGYLGCCAALRDADFRQSAKTIAAPTLLIAGSADPVTTPDDLRFLATTIQGSQLVELPAAHLSSVEAAELFNEALLNFLA